MNTFLRAALLAVGSAPAYAQSIRGVVTERGSATPLAGALASLQPVGTESDRTAVTNALGEYSILAPGAGRYVLTVRRIGVRAYVSDTLTLTSGGTLRHDVQLDRFTSLPPVAVLDRSVCAANRDQGPRVAALWQEARTALHLIVASASDSIVYRRLVRFERDLSPFTHEIVTERAQTFDSQDNVGEIAFRGQTGDSLSVAGYWQEGSDGTRYFAPDANALLSSAFLRDHCFTVVTGRDERAGLIGLAFAPVRGRVLPDVRGTLWLHAATYELALVDFRWTQVPHELEHELLGGDVHFARLPTGYWIVKRWQMTMPRAAVDQIGIGVRREAIRLTGLGQEGGMILVHGTNAFDRPSFVRGHLLRANNRPLAAARIRLLGTPYSTRTDSSGGFRFDSIPPGLYAIVADHGEFEAFGVRAIDTSFVVEEASTRTLRFRARSEKEVADVLCPGRNWRLPTLRVTLLDETTSLPIANTPVRLRGLRVDVVKHGDLVGREARHVDVNTDTDQRGVAVFCSLPAAQTLTFGYPEGDGLRAIHEFKLSPQQNGVATVRTTPP
jgi:hypothetical protein